MSASNWAICPRCLKRERERIAELQERASKGYGALPLAEFDVLRAEAAKPLDEEKFRTFREDYEFYGADEGTATYGGSCSVCKVELAFKHEHPIPGWDQ